MGGVKVKEETAEILRLAKEPSLQSFGVVIGLLQLMYMYIILITVLVWSLDLGSFFFVRLLLKYTLYWKKVKKQAVLE